MTQPPESLTDLQRAILEVDGLGLPERDAMRLVTQRVGFFVGQQRYRDELRKARAKQAVAGAEA